MATHHFFQQQQQQQQQSYQQPHQIQQPQNQSIHSAPPPISYPSSSSSSFVQSNFAPQHQHQYQQYQPQLAYNQYNHYNTYQQGPVGEVTRQRQQYQNHLDIVQQEQQTQRINGDRPSSTLPALNSLKDWFDAVDTDHSGSLSCEELQQALVNGDGWTPFNMETVRMMVNMFDRDGSGSISFKEFIGLWNYIEKWKTCFRTFDLDGSGTIDASELHKALRGFGYNLSEGMVSLIMTKYDVRGRGDISFDNFVQACVTVQTLTDAFRRIDVAGTGVVTMTYEQFLGLAISNR